MKCSYFRNPKTQNSRKWADAHNDDVKGRSKRSATALPTTYWDLHHANRYINNWKRYRKTQWKNNGY